MNSKEVNLKLHYLLFIGAFTVFFLVFQFTNTDILIQNLIFDFSSHVFPAKDNRFIELYLHFALKTAMYIAGLAAIFWLYLQLRAPSSEQLKYAYIAAALTLIIAPSAVAIWKNFSSVPCPWSIDIYGGNVAHLPLAEMLFAHGSSGKCFPAGHATGGFVWLSRGIIFWHSRPKLALMACVFGSVLGVIMGISRMMQGAHFLSHTIASMLTVWLTTLFCIHGLKFFSKITINQKALNPESIQ